tara:strand:+ start:3532 stop:3852 length:321 start_codon:yes stop_codon:yes gene_type:complete
LFENVFSSTKKICSIKTNPPKNTRGEYKKLFDEKTLTFNIITTNKNNTAIAPTYTIIKIKPKNSALNKNKIPEALQKAAIKKRTECTGFCDNMTKMLLVNNKNMKK